VVHVDVVPMQGVTVVRADGLMQDVVRVAVVRAVPTWDAVAAEVRDAVVRADSIVVVVVQAALTWGAVTVVAPAGRAVLVVVVQADGRAVIPVANERPPSPAKVPISRRSSTSFRRTLKTCARSCAVDKRY
jgi:hypothetical protein